MALDDEDLKKHIEDDSFKKYQQKRKPLQVHTVLNLLREQHTFLLAATGFGKSHIPEIYLNMTTKDRSGRFMGVVVVLKPLDALGDNQVVEKVAASYSAINLTAPNFDHKAAFDVQMGQYRFIYLSPEIFLNNIEFEDIYLSLDVQQKVVPVVVDKPHMIYMWGLTESGQRNAKKIICDQNQGTFQPLDGNLATAL